MDDKMITEIKNQTELQDLAMHIQRYYSGLYNYDYELTRQAIQQLGITNIWKKDDKTYNIKLMAPGLFVGKRGANIDKLHQYLSEKMHKPVFFCIHEEKILKYLYPGWDDEVNF